MPTTPGGRFSPGDSDDWDLVTDLAAMQVSNESASATEIAAIPSTYRVGTNAQRLAIPVAQRFEGLKFYATDTRIEWLYTNNAWRGDRGLFYTERSAAQPLSSGWNIMNAGLGTPNYNDIGTWSAGALTIARSGVYRYSAAVDLGSASNPMSTQITKNSTAPDSSGTIGRSFLTASGLNVPIAGVSALATGDVIRLLVFTSAANNLSTTNSPSATHLSLELIRAL